MFVGEAPGADEDEQGEPFVGKAGQLLTKIIQTMGLQRGDVYIANILKCRPDTPGQSAGNRKPTPEEMQTCIPYLHEQIDLIRPKVLVALGATAVEGLLGKTVGITKLRGNWQTYRGIPLMPTYHPAYLLRNQALSEKRRVWEDMLQVMEKLAHAHQREAAKFLPESLILRVAADVRRLILFFGTLNFASSPDCCVVSEFKKSSIIRQSNCARPLFRYNQRLMFKPLIDWYMDALTTGGYPLIVLLMAMESSIVPVAERSHHSARGASRAHGPDSAQHHRYYHRRNHRLLDRRDHHVLGGALGWPAAVHALWLVTP